MAETDIFAWLDQMLTLDVTSALILIVGSLLLIVIIRKALKWAIIIVVTGLLIFAMFNYTAMHSTWMELFPAWETYNLIYRIAIILAVGAAVSITVTGIYRLKKVHDKYGKKDYFMKVGKCKKQGGEWDYHKQICRLPSK